MADSGDDVGLDSNGAVELTGKIAVIAIVVLFLVVVFALFLHLYAKWFWWHVEEPAAAARQRRRRRRFVFAPGQDPATAAARKGLEPSVLRALPVTVFMPDEFKEGLECSVCLSELAEGDKVRLLPKCNHGFHVDCIDMWFQSHVTCPLCRNPVAGSEVPSSANADSAESNHLSHSSSSSSFRSTEESLEPPNLPTNVLFWGDETRVNSGNGCLEEGTSTSSSGSTPEGMLVIDIPRQDIENQATSVPASTSGCAQEELKSPVMTRLRSLKRLLSREKKSIPATSCDAEQAEPRSLPC